MGGEMKVDTQVESPPTEVALPKRVFIGIAALALVGLIVGVVAFATHHSEAATPATPVTPAATKDTQLAYAMPPNTKLWSWRRRSSIGADLRHAASDVKSDVSRAASDVKS